MTEPKSPAESPAVPPKRSPGHRGQDVRDTMAEMAAKAHEISLEAGSKMAAAMKDVIGAAAGWAAFSIESARDLVQYMVRRGQMAQDEADKLIAEAEAAWLKKNKGKLPPKPSPAATPAAKAPAAKAPAAKAPAKPAAAAKPAAKPAPKAPVKKAPAKPAAKQPVKKAPAKPAAKKPAPKKPAPKKPAPKK